MKGQGAVEYLLLLGGAIVVASLVVMMILLLYPNGLLLVKGGWYSAEVKKLQALTGIDLAALTGYYRFEDNLIDTSGKGNDGYAVGGTPIYVTGKKGKAMQSPVISGFHVTIKPGAYNGLADFTIMGFVNFGGVPTIGGQQIILVRSGGVSNRIYLNLDNTSATTYADPNSGAGSTTFNSTIPINTGGYHHIAWTRTSSTGAQSFYVDCQPATVFGSPSLTPGTITADEARFTPGYSGTSGYILDEFFIIGRVLSQNEIRALAQC